MEFFYIYLSSLKNFEMTQKNVTSHSKLKALEQSRSDEKLQPLGVLSQYPNTGLRISNFQKKN